MKGMQILSGQWRPQYPYEHIAWVSPPWDSDGFIWLDFPEAVFTHQGLLFLSHYSSRFPTIFPDALPAIAWDKGNNSVQVERVLPNQVSFKARVEQKSENTAGLTITIKNGSPGTVQDIKLQTCAYLRACKEFAEYSNKSKYVHTPQNGWQTMYEAASNEKEEGTYRIGWRAGRKLLDRPYIVTLSAQAQRLAAMTWFKDTFAVTGNPQHPCMHADPYVKDLGPGESATVRGELVFFEGSLEQFDASISR